MLKWRYFLLFSCYILELYAHGAQPKVLELQFVPNQSTPLVIDNLGLFSFASEQTGWRWLCDDAINAQNGLVTAFIFDDNRMLATSRSGNYLSLNQGCDFELLQGPISELVVGKFQRDYAQSNKLWAYTQSLGKLNDLFVSEDGGQSWVGKGLNTEGIIYGFWQSPSNPEVIYLNHASGFLKSMNGGESFEALNIQEGTTTFRFQELRILTIHPSNPQHLIVAAAKFPASILLESKDGGNQWQNIHQVEDNYESAAYWPEEDILVVSTPFKGFFKRKDLFWTQSASLKIGCLSYQGNRLWSCGKGLPADWLVAYSDDHGDSWIVSFENYQNASMLKWDCAVDTQSARACEQRCLGANCAPNGTKLDLGVQEEQQSDMMISALTDQSMSESTVDQTVSDEMPATENRQASVKNNNQGCDQSSIRMYTIDMVLIDLIFLILVLSLWLKPLKNNNKKNLN